MEITVESHCVLGIKIHQSSKAEENCFYDIQMLLYFITKIKYKVAFYSIYREIRILKSL